MSKRSSLAGRRLANGEEIEPRTISTRRQATELRGEQVSKEASACLAQRDHGVVQLVQRLHVKPQQPASEATWD